MVRKTKSKKGHAVVERVTQRNIRERVCAQKGCKFFGEPARQGVCFDAKGEVAVWDKLAAHEKALLDELKHMKKREGKAYGRALEAYYVTAMMAWQLVLDECVRLRRDVALLRAKKLRRRR